jgi:tetratricopeptide (TPR) repeat protein
VAWVAERKDVLSTSFGLLTLMAYAAYAKASLKSRGERLRGGAVWYGAALGLFACGLMSKPMLVTWPFVMLLLDFWPLNRITTADGKWQVADGIRKRWHYLLLEKIPFFALTAGSCVLTFFAQRAGGAVQSMDNLPVTARVANAVVSYARYLGKTFWPAELSAFYPHPLHWPEGVVLGAGVVLVGLVALGLWAARERYVLFGLCWFLGTLVPVIGLVQVGGQAIADRYLYIPQIGILIATVWGTNALATQYRISRTALAVVAGLGLLGCGWVTRQYLPKWQNSVTLFQHALTVDAVNPPALYSLGLALCTENKYAEALPYLEKAATLHPHVPTYQGQLALAYESLGDIGGAIERYRKCLESYSDLPEALNNLAWLLATSPEAKHRNGTDAVRFATRACELTQYEWPMFLGTLAASYAEAGRFPEAVATAEKAEAMARKRGFTELAKRNMELLKEYRAGRPHRESGSSPTTTP